MYDEVLFYFENECVLHNVNLLLFYSGFKEILS